MQLLEWLSTSRAVRKQTPYAAMQQIAVLLQLARGSADMPAALSENSVKTRKAQSWNGDKYGHCTAGSSAPRSAACAGYSGGRRAEAAAWSAPLRRSAPRR